MSVSSDQRSASFLEIAGQFKLGALVTEQSHPVTANLGANARTNIASALRLLFEVDDDVIRKYREFVDGGQAGRIADALCTAVEKGGRVFFTGCGSTGRLSIQLVSIWRDFWQQQQRGGGSVEDLENRAFAVMAGGDYALIKAVEGFEDFAAFGRKQITDLGVRAGDVVFAITEGGETSFVIGTAWQGVDVGAKVFFVYNNPDEILCRHVERSREVISDSRIEKINLTTGPMAIMGSTRMQATSIQLCVLLTVLEMVVRKLLDRRGSGEGVASALENAPASSAESALLPAQFLSALSQVHATLKSNEFLGRLAGWVGLEEGVYAAGRKINYFADGFGIDVLTDTTERSPTYCTPPFRKFDDAAAAESWAFLFVPRPKTPDAWSHVIKRQPRCIDWDPEAIRGLIPPDKFQRAAETIGKIGYPELVRFRIGFDGLEDRPVEAGDSVIAILGEQDKQSLVEKDGGVRLQLEAARKMGARRGILFVGGSAAVSEVEGFLATWDPDCIAVTLPVPRTEFLLDGVTRVGLKIVLNALSTCTMARLGRVSGNTMIWVVPSNLKLIDRATRYIQHLAGLGYAAANRLLFDVIEHLEPRMRADQAYPPAVALALLRSQGNLDNAEAERRFWSESARTPLQPPPSMACPLVPVFDDSFLESVRAAFANSAICRMGQAWLRQNEPAFRPAMVRMGWRGQSVYVFAELTDDDIHSHATRLNERLWELGDVFEMFFRPQGSASYVELQVAPGNQQLQLAYANPAMLGRVRATGRLEEALIPGQVFRSRTWIEPRVHRWCILAEVPAFRVCGADVPPVGARCHFSFSRYDYTRGWVEPVISSTSPHALPDFHRHQEWGVMEFTGPGIG